MDPVFLTAFRGLLLFRLLGALIARTLRNSLGHLVHRYLLIQPSRVYSTVKRADSGKS